MIIYEITARVQKELEEQFEQFMRDRHIPDLLQTGYFKKAEMAQISDGNYRIRYQTKDRETLDRYFETDAEGLRRDFIKNFPEGVEVSREIL